jgi:hypothetical protein
VFKAECDSFDIRIYVSGEYTAILHQLQLYCADNGMCFSCKPTDYVFTHGRESGAEILAINYPRFPTEPEDKIDLCKNIAVMLITSLGMGSATVVTPVKSYFFDRR